MKVPEKHTLKSLADIRGPCPFHYFMSPICSKNDSMLIDLAGILPRDPGNQTLKRKINRLSIGLGILWLRTIPGYGQGRII